MKKTILSYLNNFFERYGYILLKKYQLDHDKAKYRELILEMEKNFHSFAKGYVSDKKRTELLAKLYGTGVSEALYLIYYLNKSKFLDGDVCEFGIANGATSALIANEIIKDKKNLWLFDSFSGLSKPTKKDILIDDIFGLGSMEKYEGTMSYGVEEVKSRLKMIHFPLRRARIVKGFIEKTIGNKGMSKKVCFAFIDFDLYQPIATALDFLNRTLVRGGYIVVDDYGYFSAGAKSAVDEFMKKNSGKYKLIKPKKYAGHFCILQKME